MTSRSSRSVNFEMPADTVRVAQSPVANAALTGVVTPNTPVTPVTTAASARSLRSASMRSGVSPSASAAGATHAVDMPTEAAIEIANSIGVDVNLNERSMPAMDGTPQSARPMEIGKAVSSAIAKSPLGTPIGVASSAETAANGSNLSPSVASFASRLAITQPTRTPSPQRIQAPVVPIPTLSAQEILADMGLTTTEIIVASPSGEDEPDTVRYLIVTGSAVGNTIVTPTSKVLSNSVKPFCALVALDTEAPVDADQPIRGGTPKNTVIESASAKVHPVSSAMVGLLSTLPSGISGIASLNNSVIRSVHRGASLAPKGTFISAPKGSYEEALLDGSDAVLTVVADGSKGGAQTAVIQDVSANTPYGNIVGTLPVIAFSSLIASPEKSIAQSLEATEQIKRTARDLFAKEMSRLSKDLDRSNELVVSAVSAGSAKIKSVISKFGEVAPAAADAVDKALSRATAYHSVYERARSSGEFPNGLPGNNEENSARVLANLEKYSKMSPDVNAVTSKFLYEADRKIKEHEALAAQHSAAIAASLKELEEFLALQTAHAKIAGGDLTSVQ